MTVRGGATRGESDLVVMAFVVIAGLVAMTVLFAGRGPGYIDGAPGFGAGQVRPGQARMIPAQTLIAPLRHTDSKGFPFMGHPASTSAWASASASGSASASASLPVSKEFGDFGVLPMPSSALLAASDLAGVGRGASGGGASGGGSYGSLDEAFPDPLRRA